jgi:hypothetical protein
VMGPYVIGSIFVLGCYVMGSLVMGPLVMALMGPYEGVPFYNGVVSFIF